MLFLIKEETIPIIKYMNIHKYMYSILLHMRYTNINIYSSDESVRVVLTIPYDMHFTFFSSYILFYSEPEWTYVLSDVEVDEFGDVVGPTTPLPPDTSVLSLFKMFFTTALMGSMVEQTNTYALLVLGENHRWRNINDTDIWAFLGVCILMGINRLPALHHYWSANPLFTTILSPNAFPEIAFCPSGGFYTL